MQGGRVWVNREGVETSARLMIDHTPHSMRWRMYNISKRTMLWMKYEQSDDKDIARVSMRIVNLSGKYILACPC